MQSRGKTPRGNETQNHWRTDKLRAGESFSGWIAGSGLCVQCHEAPTTKPCLKRYTGFDCVCPGCALGLPLVDIIFTPVYREIVLGRCVVPLRYSAARAVESMPLHHSVIVVRPTARNEGRRIETRPKPMAFPGGREHELPACIASWLPTLWRYTDRITDEQLLAGPVFASPPVVTETKTTKALTDEQEKNLLREKQAQHTSFRRTKSEAVGLGDVVDGVLGGRYPVSNNGTGH